MHVLAGTRFKPCHVSKKMNFTSLFLSLSPSLMGLNVFRTCVRVLLASVGLPEIPQSARKLQ